MSTTLLPKPTASLASAVRLNVVLLAILAAAAIVTPVQLLSGFGIANAPWAVFGLVRIFAVFALVLAVVLWSARDWLQSKAGQNTVRALTAAYAASALFLFLQQWTVWYGRSGLSLVFGCAILAVSYGLAAFSSATVKVPVA